MTTRSLLTLGLLASTAFAAPNWAATSTTTVTKTKTTTEHETKTKTTTVHETKTKTETETKTTTLKPTVTVTGSCSASAPLSSSTSVSSTSSASTSASSSASSATSSPSSVTSATATTSSTTNTNPTITKTATDVPTATASGLNVAAKNAGKRWLGTAADIPGTGEGADPYYLAEFSNANEFGEATPANTMKFFATEPQQNVFNFTGGDYFVQQAKASGKEIRCHNLIWANQLSDWVTSPAVPWTNATLTAALRNHVTKVIEHFGDDCYSWDVVNEPLSDSPAGAWAANVWYNTIGEEYFFQAFDAATQAVKANNLAVKLYVNDYNIEYLGNKSIATQGLVKELKSRGLQIDGVGLESHFIAGETPAKADQVANMQAFTALDVDVVVTELDVRLDLPATAASESQQKLDYYNTVAACVSVARCVGVVVWDFVDTYSWIPSTFPGQGYGDLFLQPGGANTPLVKKEAYDGVLEALEGLAEIAA
ncbi:hypothetical protein B0A48_00626 [Cryoendolithus antarcticus]|uniref:Beta-xylanase n=1 Tax=Cryoendolithus antarcticus TaxID=1507870 RepID=A0A1V8TV96_9PEZI|nr:hypothetical protein B0A48_00626 [Cryoendolithus antarcticus]